jgi:hypothetical protein
MEAVWRWPWNITAKAASSFVRVPAPMKTNA